MAQPASTYVVTGASRGLGRATAERLATRGVQLALCARSAEPLRAVATALTERHGVAVLASAVDLAEPDQITAFAREVVDRFGAPRGVVNNAAVLGPVGALSVDQLDRWAHALQVDVVGPAAVIAAFAPAMAEAGGGSIVNLSGGGIGGPGGAVNLSAYLTAKAGLVALTEALARELVPAGIRVNAIAPGPMPTAFVQEILDAGAEGAGTELFEATVANLQLDGGADAFLDLLEFVLSDESAWLTGRLLSARWDSPADLRARRAEIEQSSLLQLRRIDGSRFREHPDAW